MPLDSQEKLELQRALWRRDNHDRPVIGFTGTYFSTDINPYAQAN